MSVQPIYEVYKKTSEGKRGQIVEGIVSMQMLYRKNDPTKWSFTGAGLDGCPLSETDEIVVFRNGVVVFSGYVEQIAVEYDAATRIYDWEAEGLSNLGKLYRRLTWANPMVENPTIGYEYTDTGYFADVLLTLARVNAALQAQEVRQIPLLDITTLPHVGETVMIGAEYDNLFDYIHEMLADSDFCIRDIWNGYSGSWDVEIYSPRDISGKVIFSVESGSISYYKKTVSAPKGNWLLVKGVTNTETDKVMSVIVSDQDSIDKWGRIELLVNRTDITQITETDDQGQLIYREPWSSVANRLEEAAYKELENASAQTGYELVVLDIDRFSYKSDWDVSDIVAVRIGADEMTAQIEEISVEYSAGIETVTPSIGALQKGELMTVFDELGRLKTQVNILSKEY